MSLTTETIEVIAALIKSAVKLGIDIYAIIKDAGLNDADVEELCAMVDEAVADLRKPE
jgi:uncharacterized protein (DUF2252 family)